LNPYFRLHPIGAARFHAPLAWRHRECGFAAQESSPHFSFRLAEKKNRRWSGEKEKGA